MVDLIRTLTSKYNLLLGRHKLKSKPTYDQDGEIICISELRTLIEDDKLFYSSTQSLFSPDGLLTSEKLVLLRCCINEFIILLKRLLCKYRIIQSKV